MEGRRGRGRPPKFLREDRQQLAALIRLHGINGARQAAGRPVCQETLARIAREFGIVLKKGKRPRISLPDSLPLAAGIAPQGQR